jgi:hypothetical protein
MFVRLTHSTLGDPDAFVSVQYTFMLCEHTTTYKFVPLFMDMWFRFRSVLV